MIGIAMSALAFFACSEKSSDSPTQTPELAINSCEGCHTNYNALKELADPEEPPTGGHGCSGDATYYEPYDRVYLGGTGYEEFKKSKHGELGCTYCHNGVDGTSDKNEAHSGDFLAKPSSQPEKNCQGCHNDIVENSVNSIHEQGWGQKRKVTVRSGLNGPHEFDKLPDSQKEGYMHNCASCHASCGDCHVNRPPAGGGGLANGHMFSRKPDMLNVCVTCHTSRGGHAYLGVAPGTKPDVHLTKLGFDCMSCHSKTDVHGDGQMNLQRYAVAGLPKCEDCHSGIAKKNKYHSMHYSTLSCYTCHSQPYNNCGSCHIGGEGARIASYQDYKIGVNPIKDLRNYDMALLRRTPMAPDSWSNFGVAQLNNYAAFPTYNYTTPHNINRWTAVTQVEDGKACYYNCHIIKEGETYRNKELFLFKSDLQPWEEEASANIVVDGKLPESWGVK